MRWKATSLRKKRAEFANIFIPIYSDLNNFSCSWPEEFNVSVSDISLVQFESLLGQLLWSELDKGVPCGPAIWVLHEKDALFFSYYWQVFSEELGLEIERIKNLFFSISLKCELRVKDVEQSEKFRIL